MNLTTEEAEAIMNFEMEQLFKNIRGHIARMEDQNRKLLIQYPGLKTMRNNIENPDTSPE